jgi:hypothetical protein
MEKASAGNTAEYFCTMGTAVILDQDDGDADHEEFWTFLGDGTIGPDQQDDEAVTEFTPLLFQVDKLDEPVATGTPIQKTSKVVPCLPKSSLDESAVFLLDAGWEVYIWIGKGADTSEKIAALTAVEAYSKTSDSASRVLEVPVHIVKQGQEPIVLWSYFE